MSKRYPTHTRALLAAAALLGLAIFPAQASTYQMTVLEAVYTTDYYLSVASIDNNDVAVGQASSFIYGLAALRWQPGSSQAEIIPGGSATVSAAISRKKGYIVGSRSYGHKPVLWNPDGSVVTLLPLEKNNSPDEAGQDVDDKGQVVGSSYLGGERLPVVWKPGQTKPTVLPTPAGMIYSVAYRIAANGWIVGYGSADYNNYAPLVWKGGALQDTGGLASFAGASLNSVNSMGSAVGRGSGEAILWQQGVVTKLPHVKGSTSCEAYAINENDEVVGNCYGSDDGGGYSVGALWNGTKTIDLNTRLQPSDVAAGWKIIRGLDINDNGSILAQAEFGSDYHTRYVLLRPLKD